MKYIDPKADLKNYWLPLVRRKAIIITLLSLTLIAIVFPEFKVKALKNFEYQVAIDVENVPITKQEIKKTEQPKAHIAEVIEADPEEEADTQQIISELTPEKPPPPPPEDMEVFPYIKVEVKPELINRPIPVYPELARKSGLEGVVVVRFTIDTNGTVLKGSATVKLARPEGIFENAALQAIYQWKFSPAYQRDRKVRVKWEQPIQFKISSGK